jgi:hypothetical protein
LSNVSEAARTACFPLTEGQNSTNKLRYVSGRISVENEYNTYFTVQLENVGLGRKEKNSRAVQKIIIVKQPVA